MMYLHIYHAIALISVNRFEEAYDILNSKKVLEASDKQDLEKAFYLRIKLFICTEKYLECYNYIKENIHLFYNQTDDTDIEIMLFLKERLNMEVDDYRDLPSYFMRQIVSYNADRCDPHIVLSFLLLYQKYFDTKTLLW